jgi:large subunit ribosomal protein L23
MSRTRTSDVILVRPVVSEKSYAAMAEGRYVFRCRPDANKIEIKKAVEDLFSDQKIEVLAVNTINVRGKVRLRSRGRTRIEGRSPDWKKAIVTLAPGQQIKGLFEGV